MDVEEGPEPSGEHVSRRYFRKWDLALLHTTCIFPSAEDDSQGRHDAMTSGDLERSKASLPFAAVEELYRGFMLAFGHLDLAPMAGAAEIQAALVTPYPSIELSVGFCRSPAVHADSSTGTKIVTACSTTVRANVTHRAFVLLSGRRLLTPLVGMAHYNRSASGWFGKITKLTLVAIAALDTRPVFGLSAVLRKVTH